MKILFNTPIYGGKLSELLKAGTVTIVVVNAQSYPFLDVPLIHFYHGLSESANPMGGTEFAYFVPEQHAYDWMAYVEHYYSAWRKDNWQIVFAVPNVEGKIAAFTVERSVEFTATTPFVGLVPLADTKFTVTIPETLKVQGSVNSTVVKLPSVVLAENQTVGVNGSVSVSELPAINIAPQQSVAVSNTPSVKIQGPVDATLPAGSTVGVYPVIRPAASQPIAE